MIQPMGEWPNGSQPLISLRVTGRAALILAPGRFSAKSMGIFPYGHHIDLRAKLLTFEGSGAIRARPEAL